MEVSCRVGIFANYYYYYYYFFLIGDVECVGLQLYTHSLCMIQSHLHAHTHTHTHTHDENCTSLFFLLDNAITSIYKQRNFIFAFLQKYGHFLFTLMIMMMINLTKEKRNPKLQEQIDLIHEI